MRATSKSPHGHRWLRSDINSMESPSNQGIRRVRLPEFDSMRGVAIIMVAVSHGLCYTRGQLPGLLVALVAGWTSLFVFISGFFFDHVYAEDFRYGDFMKKKVLYVLVPFAILTIGTVGFAWFRAYCWGTDEARELLANYIDILRRGGYVFAPYWYVPFIVLLSALAPLHVWYCHLSRGTMLTIFVAALAVTCLIHRSPYNLNVIQSVVYFQSFYLLGIFYSRHRDWMAMYGRPIFAGAVLVLVIALVMQLLVSEHPGSYSKSAFTLNGVDWMAVQKTSLCLLLIHMCSFLRTGLAGRVFAVCADLSFGLFFLHVPIQNLARRVVAGWAVEGSDGSVVLALLDSGFVSVVGIAGAAMVVLALRATVGRKLSRLLVGA